MEQQEVRVTVKSSPASIKPKQADKPGCSFLLLQHK